MHNFLQDIDIAIIKENSDSSINYNKKFKNLTQEFAEVISKVIISEAKDNIDQNILEFNYSVLLDDNRLEFNIKTYNSEKGAIYVTVESDHENKLYFENWVDHYDNFKNIFEHSITGNIIIDKENKIVMTNEKFLNMFNLSMIKIIGKKIFALFNLYKNKANIALLKNITLNETVSEEVEVQLYFNNELKWYLVHFKKLPNINSGNIFIQFIDINDKKKSEEKIELEKQKYSTMLNNIPGLTYRSNYSNNKTVEFINQGALKLTGYDKDFFLNKHNKQFFSIVPEPYRTSSQIKINKSFDKMAKFSTEYPIITSEGKQKWVWELGEFVEIDNQTYLEGIIIDIDKQKLAEEKLYESQQRLDLAVQGGGISVWTYDYETKETSLDKKFHQILGLLNKNEPKKINELISLIHPDDVQRFTTAIEKTLSGSSTEIAFEIRMRHRSGAYKWISNIGRVTESYGDNSPKSSTGIVIDITNKKNHEQELLNATILAQENERKRVALDLHDGISQYLAAIKMNIQALSPEQKYEVELRQRASELIDYSIKELRAISHNLMPGAVNDLGLKVAIEEIIDSFNISSLKINFKINFTERINKDIELTFYRIFQELVNNTSKHAKASEVDLEIFKHHHQITFEYADNGIGINKNKMDKFGIGLNNIKNRVYALNGTIKISSIEGEGYKTTINIPYN